MAKIRDIQRSNPISNFRQTGPSAASGFALLAEGMDTAYEMLLPAAIKEQQAAGEELGRKIAGGQLGERAAVRYPSYETASAKGLKGLVDKTEGGGAYNTLFGFSQKDGGKFAGVDVSKMTIGQALRFASPSGAYGQWVKSKVGRVATPMGRFQIVGTTLRNAAKEMGLDENTPFNEATQERIFDHLASKRLQGPLSQAGKRTALRQEWEGFKHVSDSDLDAAIAEFESGATAAPTQSAAPLTVMADADGKLTGKLYSPLSGPILQAHNAAAQSAYQAEVLDRAAIDLLSISTDNALNPEGYAESAASYIDDIVEKAPSDLAPGLRASLEGQARKRYVGMVDDKHRDIRQRAANSNAALMTRYSDDYAQAIVTGDPEAIAEARRDLDGVLRARESLPGLAWTPEQSANEFIRAENSASRAFEKQRSDQSKAWKSELDLITDAAKSGMSASSEEILQNPDVAAAFPEKHAEAMAYTTLRDQMPAFQTLTPQEQAQAVAEMRDNPIDADFEIDIAETADKARKANAKAWDEDPVKRAAEVLPQKPPSIPSLIAGNDLTNITEALQERRVYMNGLLEQGYISAKRFFSEDERTGLQALIGKGADPQMKAMAAAAISTAFGADAGRALEELGADPVTQHVGALVANGADLAVAQEAMLGQARLAENTVMLPSKAATIGAVSPDIAEAMPNLPRAEGKVLETAKALYAARAEGVDHTSDAAIGIMEQAVQDALGQRTTGRGVLGGVQDVFGSSVLLSPEMNGQQLQSAITRTFGGVRIERGKGLAAKRVMEAPAMEAWEASGNGVPSWNGADLSPAVMRAARLVPITNQRGEIVPNKYRIEVNGTSDVQTEDGNVFIFDAQQLVDEVR